MTTAASQPQGSALSTFVPSIEDRISAEAALAEWNQDDVLKMTMDVFPLGEINLSAGADPELKDEEYIVVSVITPGEVKELVALDGQWHRRLREIIGVRASFYRLDLSVA